MKTSWQSLQIPLVDWRKEAHRPCVSVASHARAFGADELLGFFFSRDAEACQVEQRGALRALQHATLQLVGQPTHAVRGACVGQLHQQLLVPHRELLRLLP